MKNTVSLAWHLSCSLTVRLWCIVRWPDRHFISAVWNFTFAVPSHGKKIPLARLHERKYSWMYYFKHAAVDLVVHVCADWQKTVYRKWELWRLWMCVPNSSASLAPWRPWGANIAGCCATFSWTRPSCLELATSLRTKPCLTLASTQLWRYEKKMIDCIEQENNTVFPERFWLLNYRVSL